MHFNGFSVWGNVHMGFLNLCSTKTNKENHNGYFLFSFPLLPFKDFISFYFYLFFAARSVNFLARGFSVLSSLT